MKALLIVLLTCFVATACMSQATQGTEKDTKENIMKLKRLESLHSVSPKDNHIEITVTEHGCTASEHFDIQIEKGNDRCLVSIYRIHPDVCRRAPLPITLKLPWNANQACGDVAIKILNPLKPKISGIRIDSINWATKQDHTKESAK